jgi:hypothetical protein
MPGGGPPGTRSKRIKSKSKIRIKKRIKRKIRIKSMTRKSPTFRVAP